MYHEHGRIWRRPNPHNIVNRPDSIPQPIETPESNPFADKIPIGSEVWRDKNKEQFGRTIPGGIYGNPKYPFVYVDGINGYIGKLGVWTARDVILRK